MLPVIEKTLKEINQKGISYIHFKSNEHLKESFCGETDLDVLVDQKGFDPFVDILVRNGFSLFRSVGKQAYNGIFDYLFIDGSGKVIHFHLHTVYITGAKFIKEYHLPIEEYLLSNRRFDETGTIMIPDPAVELCLLWIRFFAKMSPVRFILKGGHIGKGFLKESEWLSNSFCEEKAKDVLERLFEGNTKLQEEVLAFIKEKKEFGPTLKAMISTRNGLRVYKKESFTEIKYAHRRFAMMVSYLLQQFFHRPVPYRRILPSGGKVIAVIGCDGAGKSTVNAAITKSVRKKADVFFEYFGSGDGHCCWFRYPLLLVYRILSFRKKAGTADNGAEDLKKRESISFPKAVWAVLLALEKKEKMRRVDRAISRGMIVLCDRYPQVQFPGINDGPLLACWMSEKNTLKRKIALWETRIYEQACSQIPDLVIKLMITEEVSQIRKPDESIDRIRRKIDLMDELTIPAKQTAVIDATASLDEVLRNVYESVSKCISST